MDTQILAQIAAELQVRPQQVQTAVELLDGGATVPFIARYRKGSHAGPRRCATARAGNPAGLLARTGRAPHRRAQEHCRARQADAELQAAIAAAPTKQALEDLYLPYKQKRRTRGLIAREAGLEPLADALFADPSQDPLTEAARFLNPDAGFADAHAVLDGVRDLLAERWAEDAVLVGKLREWLWEVGLFQSKLCEGKSPDTPDHAKFRDYFDYANRSAPCPRTARWRCSAVVG